MNPADLVQTQVLHLTVSEAENLLRRVRNCRTFITYGIEVYTVTASKQAVINPVTGEVTEEDGVNVMVRAETDMQAGIGKGFLFAVYEGIGK
jgi:hypothetical protein